MKGVQFSKPRRIIIIWFGIGFLISYLSNVFNIFNAASIIEAINISSLNQYYLLSNKNNSIILLFWFYLISLPFMIYKDIASKREYDYLSLKLQPYMFILALVFFVQILFFPDVNASTKKARAINALIISNWVTTYIIYSVIFWFLLENTSSLFAKYIKHNNSLHTDLGRERPHR